MVACARCGGRSRVYRTVDDVRYRRCVGCGFRFSTIEVPRWALDAVIMELERRGLSRRSVGALVELLLESGYQPVAAREGLTNAVAKLLKEGGEQDGGSGDAE